MNINRSCAVLFLAAVFASAAWAEERFPVDRLHIVVAIDGSDELHLSQQKATWVHKSWGYPTEVRINGRIWNPQQRPVLAPGPMAWLQRKDLDLSGAELHKLRGRGSVQLGCDTNGLVVAFDDPENGADTYEVTIDFAEMLARKRTGPTNGLELRIRAEIDGMDEVRLAQRQARWIHSEWRPPAQVTVNGRPWNVMTHPTWELEPPLMPENMNLQKATLSKLAGRGIMNLEYLPGLLCLDFEDHEGGADTYEAVVKVPPFGERHLVRINADAPGLLAGAALKVYRLPEENEARALVAGQRVFDARGQCLVALEPGQYEFEVLHQPEPRMLVALKTGPLKITGPKDIDLRARRIEPQLYGPEYESMTLDEFLVRSTRRSGAISWKAPPQPGTEVPVLLLSSDQTYKIHAFGHSGTNYVALWRTVTVPEMRRITVKADQWLSRSFRWRDGTPRAVQKGVVLDFPDGRMEIAQPEEARFFTNRRFCTVAYWLAFAGGRRAVFQPRGYVHPGTGNDELTLGGALCPLASAAILQDENLGRPDAQHLWWDITLADPQGHVLDAGASKIDWAPVLARSDSRPIRAAPLLPEEVRQLSDVKAALVLSATYCLETPQTISLHPEPFTNRRSPHCFTEAPPHYDWNTRAYLAKAERELAFIALARERPLNPGVRMHIGWWFNSGAVGGNSSVTMPLSTFLGCTDWYNHPWAIAHEMMHNFGYGHTHEMDRLDRAIQERMEQFRWHVVDHPEYVPEDTVLQTIKP